MLNYHWSEDYSVGDATLDRHHQKLFGLFNQLSGALVEQSILSLMTVLSDLKDYTLYHFEEEERRMAQNNYPALKAHQAKHAEFIQAVEGAISKANDDPNGVTEEMFIFLSQWLITHIQEEDMAYKGKI